MRLLVAGLAVCLGTMAAGARADEREARFYFGHIDAPCHPARGGAACDELIRDIRNLGRCARIEDRCDEGQRIMAALLGDTHRDTLPDVLLYLDQRERAGEPYPDTFRSSRPVLMFRKRNTPHVFGARDVYAFVFSEKKACIEGVVATEFRSEPNPFSAILTVLGKSFTSGATEKKDDREKLAFTWHPLSGNPADPKMWYAVARAGIDTGSTNRMTIYYKQPNATAGEAPAAKKEDAKEDAKPKPKPAPGPGVEDECAPIEVPAGEKGPVRTADFLAANAFFSNSSDSQVTLALALGATFNARGTKVASGGSDVAYNGYALVKFYPERYRPRLHAGPSEFGARQSWGLVVGTNILNNAFDELLLGVSRGHIWGNVGITVGINSIEGKDNTDQKRKERLFLGLDYSF